MELTIHSETIDDNTLKFSLKGKLLAKDAQEFSHAVQSQLPAQQRLLFDLADLTEIDYEGLHAFVSVLQWACLKGCTAVLAAVAPVPRILFDITRVSQVFKCFDSVEEAVHALEEAAATQDSSILFL